ncbi:hypothetical protein ACFVUW_11935 [Streptomyces xiamenensis]|uniref:hypothetical protein n=1 Tax=Streptomyces xiamenensis TaxID=408015 RepID=UPI0036E05BAC
MTTTPECLELPARRRRHARRIAALTELIGACAQAAGAAYGPIAAAPPEQEGIEVSLLPCVRLGLRSKSPAAWLPSASGTGCFHLTPRRWVRTDRFRSHVRPCEARSRAFHWTFCPK